MMEYAEATIEAKVFAEERGKPIHVVRVRPHGYSLRNDSYVTTVYPAQQDRQPQRFLRELTDHLHECCIETTEIDEWVCDLQQLSIDAAITPTNIRGNLEVLIEKAAEVLWALDNA